MMSLHDQLAVFAKATGGKFRTGPQPPKPAPAPAPSIGRPQPVKPKADPWLDYTDDYSVWKQGQ